MQYIYRYLRQIQKKFKKNGFKSIAIYQTHAIIIKQTMRNKKTSLETKSSLKYGQQKLSLIKQNTTGVNELLIKFKRPKRVTISNNFFAKSKSSLSKVIK